MRQDIPFEFPRVILGTMTWGEQNTEAEAHAQMDAAFELGVNFFDTAELYPVRPLPETQGRTETYIGNWLAKHNRSDIILASKVAGPGRPHLHNGQFSAQTMREALDASLKRLRTDYLDLYQIHWPARPVPCFGKTRFEPVSGGMPIEETLEVMNEFVKAGKVRAVGVSNETPWGIAQYGRLADEKGLPRIASIQNPLSLLDRSFENGLDEACFQEEVNLIAYSPLAGGMLTGKYRENGFGENRTIETVQGRAGRFTLFPVNWSPRFIRPECFVAVKAYLNIAREAGLTPVELALGFVSSRWYCKSTIIGATSVEYMRENIAACNVTLPGDVLEQIDRVHKMLRNPGQ